MKKIVFSVMLILILMNTLTITSNIKLAKAEWTGTVYIRVDGRVDPPDAPIMTYDNVTYILTDNITSSGDGIIVERDNIVIDGAGYTVQGVGEFAYIGVDLGGRINVTIKNVNIQNFDVGIYLNNSTNNFINGNNLSANHIGVFLYSSSNNNISKNHIKNNEFGIILENFSNNNFILRNDLIDNPSYGIRLFQSSFNIISDNIITTGIPSQLDINPTAIELIRGSACNNLSLNNIRGFYYGVCIGISSNNTVFRNKIENNSCGVGIFDYDSNGNQVVENEIINNSWAGICCGWTTKNAISKNKIMNNQEGIGFYEYVTEMLISENNVTHNNFGIDIEGSFNILYKNVISNNNRGLDLFGRENIIYHNSFINNTCQADVISYWRINFWDVGYPSGGNYWSDHLGVDEKSGCDQDQPGSDGIGDTPYYICENNIDRYPFMKPEFPTAPISKPFAALSASSTTIREDTESVIFTASAYDFDGYIESYLFDYGDGHNSGWIGDSSVSWIYSNPGNYLAKVKVRDNDGIESDWSYPVNITVISIVKPVAILSASPTTVKEDIESVTFDASSSYDPDGTIVSYYFSFGDGSESGWISNSKVSKVYSNPGTYWAKVKVKDNEGLESDWSNSIKITVTALPPPPPENQKPIARLSASPTTVEEDYQSVTFDASASYDPDGNVVAYWFDYGDGTNSGWITSSKISKIYSNPGYYAAKVKVKDNNGAESDWSNTITITVIASPSPKIKSGPRVYPASPEMGKPYDITIEVENPSSITKTVWFNIQEERILPLREIVGDKTENKYKSVDIPPKQSVKFTFTYLHWWRWIYRLEEQGPIKWILRLTPGYMELGLIKNAASLIKLLVDSALADYSCRYKYTISSNILDDPKILTVDVVVPRSKVEALYTSFGLNLAGSVFTVAAVYFAWSPVGWASAISEGLSYGAADLQFNIARDPPDLNYTTIVKPQKIYIPQVEDFLNNLNDTEYKILIRHLLSLIENSNVIFASLEKYEGAKLFNDTEWMLNHLENAEYYAKIALNDLLEIKQAKNALLAELRQIGFSLNSNTIETIKSNLTESLPQIEIEVLRALNFTDESIYDIQQTLLNMPEATLLNFSQSLDIVDCLIPSLIGAISYLTEAQHEIRTTLLNETGILTYLLYVNEEIFPICIKSNSTVTGFYFDQNQKIIRFNVEGLSETVGFCNVTIPKDLLKGEPWTVMLNGTNWDFIFKENETHSFIYFVFTHASNYEVTIQGTWVVPEFPSIVILLPFTLITFIAAILLKKRKTKFTV